MKTLSGSYCKLFSASNQRDKATPFRCSTEVAFLVHQKRVSSNGFSLAVSLQLKRVPSISAVSSSDQTDVDSEEIQTISSDKPKTVRVRIKLLKECTFGEQFLVVGDDPILGLWDPCEGVPLDWSEGHVWTAEFVSIRDIPIGKVLKYKFILRGIKGAILWQPGTDRVLQTWGTEKIISVSEDWENPDLQNVVEEDFVDVLNEASEIDSNLGQILVEEGGNTVDKVEKITYLDKPSEELEEQDLSSSDNGSVIVSDKHEETSDSSSLKDDTRLGVPVLVPGLVPASTGENEAGVVKNDVVENPMIDSDEIKEAEEVKNNIVENTTTESDENNGLVESEHQPNSEETTAELNGLHVPTASLYSTETGETLVDESQQYDEEHMESNVLGSDMKWGRRALQKFLANLGFI